MALPLSYFTVTLLMLLPYGLVANAATITYDWNITWVMANPDGQYERATIGINGQWPLPVLNWTKGDHIVANVHNQLGNQSTSIHWHGIFQNGTNEMDGPVGVVQCGIPPNASFTYNFTIAQSGTYWYHSHTRGQYPDGLRQILVINDPVNPFEGQYDEEVVVTLSDWYHDQMPGLMSKFISVENPTGAEPVPQAALINDTQNVTVSVEPGKTYYFHMANIGAFAGQYFWIEGHTMKIIEVDGVFVDAAEAEMIYITAAQRYSFLVTTRNDSSANFAMVGAMDTSLFDTFPKSLNTNVTGWLVYDESASLPAAAVVDEYNPFDDMILVPQDGEALFEPVEYSIQLDLAMINLDNGANYASFNNVPYYAPKVPTLYTVLSAGDAAMSVGIYGSATNAFVLKQDEIVEIVLNNQDPGKHPMHLHGHNFQSIARGAENDGDFNPNNHSAYPAVPMRRDTLMAHPSSNLVIRFKANNPGVWLYHCHIQWHMDSGLVATMVEAPLEIQKTITIPEDHYQACKDLDTPYSGNAAGNTVNFYDLSGEPKYPGPLPSGFTAKGYVAMVFSCISAFLGLAVITWYGAAPISKKSVASVQRTVAEAGISMQ